MNRTEKQQILTELHASFASIQGAILADFQGLSVRSITEIRRAFRQEGVSFLVVKNTLARIASRGTPLEVIQNDFIGNIAIAYSVQDPIAPARLATELAKKQEKFIIRCGYIDRTRLQASDVESIAKMPSREELRAKLLGTLSAPASSFVRTLNAVPQQVALVLNAYKKKLEEAA